jgi:hypothetical protein
MERSGKRILEWWNTGIMGNKEKNTSFLPVLFGNPIFHYSILPSFHFE